MSEAVHGASDFPSHSVKASLDFASDLGHQHPVVGVAARMWPLEERVAQPSVFRFRVLWLPGFTTTLFVDMVLRVRGMFEQNQSLRGLF